jgi:tripartite-type tricarboxylate transporter receptor subunit TctC
VSRLIAQGIAPALGQQIVVENRPAGVIPGQVVSKAPPDGYTLLVNGNSFWIAPLINDNIPYDPLKDFLPITLAVSSPNVLVVHNSVPAKSVQELIKLAKSRPGVLNYGSASAGGSVHLSAELFKFMAGVDVVRVTSIISRVNQEIVRFLDGAAPGIPVVIEQFRRRPPCAA